MYQSFLKPFFSDLYILFIDLLFPITCLGCGEKKEKFLCDACLSKVPILKPQTCLACKKPSILGLTHPKCVLPFFADGAICLFNYKNDLISNAIIKGKYSFLPKVFTEFSVQMSEFIKTNCDFIFTENFYIIPLPLHKKRQRWRGFNQVEIISKQIAKDLNLPTDDILARIKPTQTQKDLKKEQRLKNITGAFALKTGANVKEKNFLLIDDVITTGATMIEACKVLKRGGANKVWLLAVAKD